jgi:class 3 adenylate cyclase
VTQQHSSFTERENARSWYRSSDNEQNEVLREDLPEGTVTFLFTDIEGSTRLLQQLGRRYTEVLTMCRFLLRGVFSQHHGREVDTQGDSFFVAFTRAKDAVTAAVQVQRVMAEHQWPAQVEVRVRIGPESQSYHQRAMLAWTCITPRVSWPQHMAGRFCFLKRHVTWCSTICLPALR